MSWREYVRHRAALEREYRRGHPIRAASERVVAWTPPVVLTGVVLLTAILAVEIPWHTFVIGGVFGTVAVMAVGLVGFGFLRWRATGAPHPLGIGIGFAVLPVLATLEYLCIESLVAGTSTTSCDLLLDSFPPLMGWVFAWFFIPILVDYSRFRSATAAAPKSS